MRAVSIENATAQGPQIVLGRPSSTRPDWEAARQADAADLNRLMESGAQVEAYVAPLWSNAESERCLGELRGFDEARVYAAVLPGEGFEEALTAIAEAEWCGAALLDASNLETSAALIYSCAALDIPIYLEHPHALKALALAIGEDLSPREIAAVLQGESHGEPDPESLDHARELLEA